MGGARGRCQTAHNAQHGPTANTPVAQSVSVVPQLRNLTLGLLSMLLDPGCVWTTRAHRSQFSTNSGH